MPPAGTKRPADEGLLPDIRDSDGNSLLPGTKRPKFDNLELKAETLHPLSSSDPASTTLVDNKSDSHRASLSLGPGSGGQDRINVPIPGTERYDDDDFRQFNAAPNSTIDVSHDPNAVDTPHTVSSSLLSPGPSSVDGVPVGDYEDHATPNLGQHSDNFEAGAYVGDEAQPHIESMHKHEINHLNRIPGPQNRAIAKIQQGKSRERARASSERSASSIGSTESARKRKAVREKGLKPSINPKIKCRISIKVDQHQLPLFWKEIEWLNHREYDNIMHESSMVRRQYLKESRGIDHESTQVDGDMALVKVFGGAEICRCQLSQAGHWAHHLPIMVGAYCAAHPSDEVGLEVNLEYVVINITPEPGQTYVEAVYEVMKEKFRRNWNDEEYLPSKWIEPILGRHVIRGLIEEDRSWASSNVVDLEGLLTRIFTWSQKLLAICVEANCISLLLKMCLCSEEHQMDDNDLPIESLPKELKGSSLHLNNFLPKQRKYHLFKFEASTDGQILHYEDYETRHFTMPIRKTARNPIGHGTFGTVYMVEIDKQHHNFPQVSKAHRAVSRNMA
jgi:hypothetical protein